MVLANTVYATTVTPMISVSSTHAVGVKSDGSLIAWGTKVTNESTTNGAYSFSTTIGADFIFANAGYGSSLAIKSDGTLWGFGKNNVGQLGDGTQTYRDTPVLIGSNFKKVVQGGYGHTIAIKNDGSLWAWGWNAEGELGDGTTTMRLNPIQIGVATDWTDVAVGNTHTIALKANGSLWAWGGGTNYNHGQIGDGSTVAKLTPTQIGSDNNWSKISANYFNSSAIKTDGTLWSWGWNNQGQLCDGTTTEKTSPTQIGTGYKNIYVGNATTFAIKIDNSLYSCGWNFYGQLGDATTIERHNLVYVGENFASVSSDYSTFAFKVDGSLWAWGSSNGGMLIDLGSNSISIPEIIGDTLAITGLSSVNESASSTFIVSLSHLLTQTEAVSGTLTLDSSKYATLSGSTLTVGSIPGNQSVNLNATYNGNGVSRTATLPVTLTNTVNILTGISIIGTCSSCGTSTVNESSTSTYGVIASYDNGSTASVSATLTLDSTPYATFSGSTLSALNVLADQQISLRATYTENGVPKTITYPITVKNSVNYLTSIAINGATSLASGGANSAYTVTATYDNGSTSTVAASLTASGNGAILISGQLLTGSITVNSTVTLSATYTENGITKTATLPVTIVAPVVATTTTTTTTTSTSTTVATTTTTTVLNKTINLVQGWNLIGSGGTSSYSVSSLFSDKSLYTSVWKWIASSSQWAFYTPTMTATDLQSFASGQGYSALDNVSGSDGIWVNAKSDTSITIPFGTAYTATNQRGNLIKNWNLISIGESLTPVRFNNYLTQYTGSAPPAIASSSTSSVFQVNLISLWAWNAPLSSWYFYSPTLDQSGTLASFIGTQGYLDFNSNNQKLQSGMGFWVNMP
jgi:alpha-tubulin suppressor-like RCC1 family protein